MRKGLTFGLCALAALIALLLSRPNAISDTLTTGGGLNKVTTNSPGLLAGSGTSTNPLTATISVGAGMSGTGSAGSPLTSTGGVSDGDKTDITVTSSGTVWNIDPGVVDIAELANTLDLGTNGPTTVGDFRGAVISPADISSTTQNDYNPTGLSTAMVVRLSASSGTANISGFAGGAAGRLLVLHHIGSNSITLLNQDAGSTAANRIITGTGGGVGFDADQTIVLVYDATTQRWRVVASPGAAVAGTNIDVAGSTVSVEPAIDLVGEDGDSTIDVTDFNDQANGYASVELITSSDITTGGSPATVYSLKISSDDSCSIEDCSLTKYGAYIDVIGVGNQFALWTETGKVNFEGPTTVDDNLIVTGTETVTGAATHNGGTTTTTLTQTGNGTYGDSSTDTLTFSNGPAGVNLYGGTFLEWTDEWLTGIIQPTAAANWPMGTLWTATANGSSLFAVNTGTTTRPGIVEFSTGSSATGRSTIASSAAAIDFGSGSWTYEATVGFPTLSTATEEYAAVLGFSDVHTAINQVDGCWFQYDRLPVATAPGTGTISATTDKWQCWCASNSVRTGYTMDGTIVSQESFTTVNAPVAALTLPSTNIYRLRVVMSGTTRAEFYVNGTKSCNINTNLPSGSARLTGVAQFLIKSAGATARLMDIDQTRVAVTLNSARFP